MKFSNQTEKIMHIIMGKTVLLFLTIVFGLAAAATFRAHILIGAVMLALFLLFFKLLISSKKVEAKLEETLNK